MIDWRVLTFWTFASSVCCSAPRDDAAADVQPLIGDGVAGEQPLEVPGRGDEDEHAAGDERDDCDVDLVPR